MKDKLEIGMYIRTKFGRIGKVLALAETIDFPIINNELEKPVTKQIVKVDTNYNFEDEYDDYLIEDVVNAKHKVIELIEEGDYINGHKIDEIGIGPLSSYVAYECMGEEYVIYEKDIISIVTKEQFAEMEFKV